MDKRPTSFDTEEDILRFQDKFNKEKKENKEFQPAATVVRIAKPNNPEPRKSLFSLRKKSSTHSQAEPQISTPTEQLSNDGRASSSSANSNVIGDVLERNTTCVTVTGHMTGNDSSSNTETEDRSSSKDIVTTESRTRNSTTIDTELPVDHSNRIIGDVIERNTPHGINTETQSEGCADAFPLVPELSVKDLIESESEVSAVSLFLKHLKSTVVSHKNESTAGKAPNIIPEGTSNLKPITSMRDEINRENIEILKSMSPEEILQAQQEIRSLVSESARRYLQQRSRPAVVSDAKPEDAKINSPNITGDPASESDDMSNQDVAETLLNTPGAEKWINFDVFEREKLEWTKNVLPKLLPLKPGEEFEARFDLNGYLLPHTKSEKYVPELHMHHDDPERPGYSLEELLRLTRANNMQQRVTGLKTIAQIFSIYNQGLYKNILTLPVQNIYFFIRFAMDTNTVPIAAAAVECISNLIYNEPDEFLLDFAYDTVHGYLQPQITVKHPDHASIDPKNESKGDLKLLTPESDCSKMDDFELAGIDLINCISRSNTLNRIRYLLNHMELPGPAVISCFKIIIRVLRTSFKFMNSSIDNEFWKDVLSRHIYTESLENSHVVVWKTVRILTSYAFDVEAFCKDFQFFNIVKKCLFTEMKSTNLIRIQVEVMRVLRMLFQKSGDSYVELYREILPAIRSLLLLHYHTLVFDRDNTSANFQHASALIQLIRVGNCVESLKHLRDIIPSCLGKWFTMASRNGCRERFQIVLLANCLDLANQFTSIAPSVLNSFANTYLHAFMASEFFKNLHSNLSTISLLTPKVSDLSTDIPALPNLGSVIFFSNTSRGPTIALAKNNDFFLEYSLLNYLVTLSNTSENSAAFNSLASLYMTESLKIYITKLANNSRPSLAKEKINWFMQYELNYLIVLLKFLRKNDLLSSRDFLAINMKLLTLLTMPYYNIILDIYRNVIFTNDYYGDIRLTNDVWEDYENSYIAQLPVQIKQMNPFMLNNWRVTILPYYWPYSLLYKFIENLENGTPENNSDVEAKIITTTFKFSFMLTDQNLDILSVTEHLCYLMTAFLSNDSLFLVNRINFLLFEQYYYIEKKLCNDFNFSFKLQNRKSFENLYLLLWDQFVSKSYGDLLFCLVLMIPLQRIYPSKWKLLVWGEHYASLKYMRLNEKDLYGSIDAYLGPIEDDVEVLKFYQSAVASQYVVKGTVLHKIAMYHLSGYLQTLRGDGRLRCTPENVAE